jgi:hypothetical protein
VAAFLVRALGWGNHFYGVSEWVWNSKQTGFPLALISISCTFPEWEFSNSGEYPAGTGLALCRMQRGQAWGSLFCASGPAD